MGSFLISFMLILFLCIFFLPILFCINLYFDTKSEKIGCNIMLYGVIKIVGGYLFPCAGGFAWHVSKRKAVIFSYRNINDERQKLSTNKAFHLCDIQMITEISPQYLISVSMLDGVIKILVPALYRNTRLENTILLREEDGLRVFAKIQFTVQVWRLALKYLLERGKKNVERQN